jgi:Transcription-silencing protein, cryptic loci regulator Clr2
LKEQWRNTLRVGNIRLCKTLERSESQLSSDPHFQSQPCQSLLAVSGLKMSTMRNTNTDSNQAVAEDDPRWTKHFPYLSSVTLRNIEVRQTTSEDPKIKDTKLLLITRSDGVHKIGYLPREDKDSRLGDGTKARQAYLCKLGSMLASKAGLSNGGNKASDAVWYAMPEVLFGYEVFARARDRVTSNKVSDVYVVGHPIEGVVDGLFRTAEEFAQHLWWLAEGDETKVCECVLCTKEARKKTKQLTDGCEEDMLEAWRQECNDRAKSYLSSTTLGSFWGDLPEMGRP